MSKNNFIIFDIMKRFNNKYRIESARLAGHDYSSDGDYFITICTSGKECFFGTVENESVILNSMGIIIEQLILKFKNQFEGIRIVEYIIMPNHVHLILKIYNPIRDNMEMQLIASLQNDNVNPINGGITGNKNPMPINGIPKMIRWFKGRATFELRKTANDFAWQSRYYDRIIRNREEYFAVINYIKNNPLGWDNKSI